MVYIKKPYLVIILQLNKAFILCFYINLPGIIASIIPIINAAIIAPTIETLIVGTKN